MREITARRLLGRLTAWSIGFVACVAAALVTAQACKHGTPTAPPPVTMPGEPPPTPPAYTPPVLTISNGVLRCDGKPCRAHVICCTSNTGVDEAIRDGWTLITETRARYLRGYGINMVHLRTGPYLMDRVGAPQVEDTTFMLRSLGMVAEVDLVDVWAIRTGNGLFQDRCEVTKGAPPERYLSHVREVVAAAVRGAGGAQHVMFNVGNEAYTCGASKAWYSGIVRAARESGAAIVGGDRADAAPSAGFDYISLHGPLFPVGTDGVRPLVFNETDGGDYSPEEWNAVIRASATAGGLTMFWRGGMTDAQVEQTLELLRQP